MAGTTGARRTHAGIARVRVSLLALALSAIAASAVAVKPCTRTSSGGTPACDPATANCTAISINVPENNSTAKALFSGVNFDGSGCGVTAAGQPGASLAMSQDASVGTIIFDHFVDVTQDGKDAGRECTFAFEASVPGLSIMAVDLRGFSGADTSVGCDPVVVHDFSVDGKPVAAPEEKFYAGSFDGRNDDFTVRYTFPVLESAACDTKGHVSLRLHLRIGLSERVPGACAAAQFAVDSLDFSNVPNETCPSS